MHVQCELNSVSSASHHEPDPVTSYHTLYFSIFHFQYYGHFKTTRFTY